ncbi:MAG: redoxin domain-containing protein [Flavisolibacter sp.]
MNKILCTAIIMALVSCNSKKDENSFVVDGAIKNSNAKMVYLQESAAGSNPVIIDSSELAKDGSFTLNGSGKEEEIYTLRSNESQYPFAILINDSKKITVNADMMNNTEPYTVKGSEASQGLIDFDHGTMNRAKKIYELSKQVDSLMKAKAPDSIINVPFSAYEAASSDLKSFTSDFLEKSSSPALSLYALGGFQRLSQQLGLKGYTNMEVAEIVNKTSVKFPQSTALAQLKKNQRSQQAPDFTMPDTTGKPVSLSSFKGKYVLIDFWASWCGPCRAENPNVVKAYNQFKDKNFTILGVSLDKNKNAWLEAIKSDGLTWNHVSDLKYWDNAAAALYGVQSIPYNVLVDPSGRIIAEELRGNDLMETLGKVLK